MRRLLTLGLKLARGRDRSKVFSPSAGFSKISRVSGREEVGRLHMHSCKGRGSSVHFIGARRQQRISKAQDGKKGNRGTVSDDHKPIHAAQEGVSV